MMRRMVLSVLVLAAMGGAAARAEPLRLSYEIRKDGEAIGREDVMVERQGGDMSVQVETHSRTTVLFMDFVFDHTRREEWRGGTLTRLVADTSDDGTKSRLEAELGEAGWKISHNGASSQRPATSMPATLWNAKVVEAPALFGTIDAAPYQVTVRRVGEETVEVMGAARPATHYRLEGDLERDLWFGADGTLLKTSFKRKGFPIEFVRVAR